MGTIAGQVLGDIRGKIGSLVFSRNDKAKIVRGYIYLNQPGTDLQLNNRAKFQEAINSWSALDLAEKKFFRDLAKYNGFKKGGYQYYVKLYMLGNLPVPVADNHLIVKKEVTVSEMNALFSSPIQLLPAPPAGKFYLIRHIVMFCAVQNYSAEGNLIIGYPGFVFYSSGVGGPLNDVIRIMPTPDSYIHNAVGSLATLPVLLSTDYGVADQGGSSSLFLQIEYSLFDWFNI